MWAPFTPPVFTIAEKSARSERLEQWKALPFRFQPMPHFSARSVSNNRRAFIRRQKASPRAEAELGEALAAMLSASSSRKDEEGAAIHDRARLVVGPRAESELAAPGSLISGPPPEMPAMAARRRSRSPNKNQGVAFGGRVVADAPSLSLRVTPRLQYRFWNAADEESGKRRNCVLKQLGLEGDPRAMTEFRATSPPPERCNPRRNRATPGASSVAQNWANRSNADDVILRTLRFGRAAPSPVLLTLARKVLLGTALLLHVSKCANHVTGYQRVHPLDCFSKATISSQGCPVTFLYTERENGSLAPRKTIFDFSKARSWANWCGSHTDVLVSVSITKTAATSGP